MAALSAFLASLTALGVYEGEKNRQNFERMRHAYEINRDYNNFSTTRSSPTPCFEALTNISNADLVKLMKYSETKNFVFDPTQHAGLYECLDEASQPPTAWNLKSTRKTRERVLKEIDAIDVALISYYNRIGDRGIICDNFEGYFGVEAVKAFFLKAIDAGVIHEANYRNVRDFAKFIADGKQCEKPSSIDFEESKPLEKYKAFLKRLFG